MEACSTAFRRGVPCDRNDTCGLRLPRATASSRALPMAADGPLARCGPEGPCAAGGGPGRCSQAGYCVYPVPVIVCATGLRYASGACVLAEPPAGCACAEDGNPCTRELCADGECVHPSD